jgi:Tfp pilus assembly protein PilN
VDTGAALPALFIGAGAVLAFVVLFYMGFQLKGQLTSEQTRIQSLRAQKTQLEQTKLQVEAFDKQKTILQQRVSTIEQLQRDRTGSQELLDMVANTVSRTENLWLTTLTRKGASLSMEGSSASINAVANFITAMKRSGYFQKVEIKESKQDEKNSAVQTFSFQITAEIAPSVAGQAKPASVPAPARGKKG